MEPTPNIPIIRHHSDLLSKDAMRVAQGYSVDLGEMPALIYLGNSVGNTDLKDFARAKGMRIATSSMAACALVEYELIERETFQMPYIVKTLIEIAGGDRSALKPGVKEDDIAYQLFERDNTPAEELREQGKQFEQLANYLAHLRIEN
ncbi:hypothetical protein KW805_00310 [Candidatus Pacearchaeota archaeon]|nr:hypothetical protein [Candidatus Pacearchaeota archaeon]